MESSTWIVDARPFGGAPADVRIAGTTIDVILPHGERSPAPGDVVIDGAGGLLLPGFVEGHTHLDKTTWAMPWYRNAVGPRLVDRIENERRWRAESSHDAGHASRALALEFLRRGTTRLRTHVDSILTRACAISKACARRARRSPMSSTCRSSRFRSRAS